MREGGVVRVDTTIAMRRVNAAVALVDGIPVVTPSIRRAGNGGGRGRGILRVLPHTEEVF
jgi:hypothetical protein